MTTILFALILLMIIGALVAIHTSNLLYSVISLGAVGFLLSIVFLFLSAPDLAITQLAVEVITLVILLKATLGKEDKAKEKTESREPRLLTTALVVAMMVGLVCFGSRMLVEFPDFGDPVMDRFADAPSNTYLRDGLEKTGAANSVTAVLLDFRAYDTLGEATVLFCAVMGTLSILRRREKQASKPLDEEGSS